MKSAIFPLTLPKDLHSEIREAAKKTGLSMADVIRQSTKAGLPKVVSDHSLEKLTPMSKEEIRQAYVVPNEEFDAPEHHCASLPSSPPEED